MPQELGSYRAGALLSTVALACGSGHHASLSMMRLFLISSMTLSRSGAWVRDRKLLPSVACFQPTIPRLQNRRSGMRTTNTPCDMKIILSLFWQSWMPPRGSAIWDPHSHVRTWNQPSCFSIEGSPKAINWNVGRKDSPVSFDQLLAEWPMLQVSTSKVTAGVRPAFWPLSAQSLNHPGRKYSQEKFAFATSTSLTRA